MSGSQSQLATQTPPISISFNEIPANLQVPGAFVEIAPNYDASGLIAYPAKVLICSSIVAGGTIAPLTAVQVFTPQQAALLLGYGGIGHRMVTAFIRANPWTALFVMGIPDGSTPAVNTWTIPITATSLTGPAGPLNLYVGGQQISVTVTPGVDTATTIAANIVLAANALLPPLPVIATSSTNTVTLTSRDKGVLTKQLDVRWNLLPGDNFPGGQTAGAYNLLAPITNNANGAGLNSIGNAFAAIPSTWFTHFVIPWSDSVTMGLVATEMARRFNSMVGLDGRCFSFVSQTSLTNLIAVTSGLNSQFISIGGLQNEPTAPWEMAALYAGVAVFNLVNDPSRQLRNLVLPGAVAPASADILTETAEQTMLTTGMATFTVGNDGTVRIQRAVSTYQFASGSIPDTSWMDIMTAETMSRIRYDWISYVGLTYPRNKMAADGTIAAEYDDTIVTPRRMQSSWGARCRLYEQLGWIQNSQATVAASVFQLDATNPNRMDARMQIQLIDNLMIFAGQLQFSLLADVATTAQT
jgi:phage tail sheath gpL-like